MKISPAPNADSRTRESELSSRLRAMQRQLRRLEIEAARLASPPLLLPSAIDDLRQQIIAMRRLN